MPNDPPHLPIEIWQIILRYAISIPAFLDPDAVAGIPAKIVEEASVEWNNAEIYEQSEAIRKSLCQVCPSWRSYLQPFENRFVKMIDIRHGAMPPLALKKAIRISFWGQICSCEICGPGRLSSSEKSKSFEEFCWKTMKEQRPLRAEILDTSRAHFQIKELLEILDAVPNLVTLSALGCSFNGTMIRLINGAPRLRHCLGRGFWGREELEGNKFNSTTLQTLFMSLPSPRLSQSDLAATNWHLPALRNLRLRDAQPGVEAQNLQDALCPLLMAIGRSLVWLDIDFRNSDYDVPSLLWTLCPYLEYLNTSMRLSNAPPKDHPIYTLSVPMVYRRKYTRIPGYSSCFPAWPNLCVLMVNEKWSSSPNYLAIYPDWVRKCKQYKIRLVDVCGETLNSYMEKRDIYFDKSGMVCNLSSNLFLLTSK
jgi:hypothetical protein